MSINGPPPDEEDEDEEDDNQHKAWETRAAIAHLLGLCEALETVERSASGGDHRLATLSARRPSFKGKEREVNGPPAGRAAGASPLQALHDNLVYLVTMYRRGLLKASDPPVPLPTSRPPALLRTTGTPNVYRFGRRVADHIIEREWLKEMAVSTRDNPEATLVKSIAVHARYLLALTSQDKEPQVAIRHLQAVLAIDAISHPDAVELVRSARRRLTSLQARLSRGPTAARAQPITSPGPKFLDPQTASLRSALGKAPAGLPLPRRLAPNRPTASVCTTHMFASASLSAGSPLSSAHSSLPSPRSRHASAPPGSAPTGASLAGPPFNPHADHSSGSFTSRMRRATSTFSNMTANSMNSLSPSLFSLKLQDERSEQAPCLVDDLLVHGQTAGPSSRPSSNGPWGWFGRKSVAEGSLRSLASANGRLSSPQTTRVPIPRATKSSRPPVPSSSKPLRLTAESVPPSPAVSFQSTPLYGCETTADADGLKTPTFKTRASDHGDKTLDPQLRQLEMSSKVTRMAACSVCGTEGVNLPECPRCRLLFCSRGCRIGGDAAGDGKKHICGILDKRRQAAAA